MSWKILFGTDEVEWVLIQLSDLHVVQRTGLMRAVLYDAAVGIISQALEESYLSADQARAWKRHFTWQ
jgi:hypothetical protein